MARQNEVNVRLTATDLISPRIAQLKSNLVSLGNVPGLQANFGMQNGFMDSLFGNLGATGVMAALNAVTTGVQNIIGSVGQAARTQTLGLAEAGDLAGRLGVSFAKAKDIVQATRGEIVKLAAALPGETEDFTTIGASISSSIAGISGGDAKKYKERLLGLTEGYGVLGAIRGADATMGGSTLNKLLTGGSNLAEAFNVELFARNPVLKEEIMKGFRELGRGRDWKELDTETRFTILDAARKKAITQETLASFDGTVESMTQLIKTNLFNPDVGIFGMLKKIGTMGNRSGLDAVQGLMQTLGSLGKATLPFVNSLGLNADSFMSGFIGVVDWFTDLTNAFTGLFEGQNIFSLDGVFESFVGGISNFFNGSFQGIEKILDNTNWLAVGAGLSRLGNAIWRGIWQLDWGAVARVLFKTLIVAPVGIMTGALANSAYELVEMVKGAFKHITEMVMGFVDSINPVNNVKKVFGIESGSKQEKLVDKVSNFGIKQAVGTIPGIGGVLKTGMEVNEVFKNKPDEVNLNNPPLTTNQPMGDAKPLPNINPENKSQTVSFNNAFNIVASPGMDTEGLADLVISKFDERYAQWKANNLA
ncbi:MAG: hypothetical protein RMX65_016595 [Nostoc sp. DedQUE01]|nr:hypothetical protein [Nostoc sp. DedQUE01]